MHQSWPSLFTILSTSCLRVLITDIISLEETLTFEEGDCTRDVDLEEEEEGVAFVVEVEEEGGADEVVSSL